MPEDPLNVLVPRTPKERIALEIFEGARDRAYAGDLSDQELQAALAKLGDLARSASDWDERSSIESKAHVLSEIRDIVEMDRMYAPIANSQIVAKAESVYANAGRESADEQEFRRRLREGMEKLGGLHDRATEPAEQYVIAELIGSLDKTLKALEHRRS